MKSGWFRKLQNGLEGLGGLAQEAGDGRRVGYAGYERYGSGLWQRLAGRSPELLDAEEDVAAEQQGRLAIISRDELANRWLLAQIRQQPLTPSGRRVGREGFFTLVQLPAEKAGEPVVHDDELWPRSWLGLEADEVIDLLTGMDVLLYLFCSAEVEMAADLRWWARLRATRAPVVPILLCASGDGVAARQEWCAALRRQLGVAPVCLVWAGAATAEAEELAEEPAAVAGAGVEKARTLTAASVLVNADEVLLVLVERILALRARLAVALAQEVPTARSLIVRRVIRTGALMTTMLGAEPVPLLDLPLQVAVQWKVALQLAAIYGRPGLDARSREMMGTILLNLCVRQVAQQAIKLVPGVGWLLSGLVSGGSTWVLGRALVGLYEEDRLLVGPQQMWEKVVAKVKGASPPRPEGPLV